MEVRFNSETWPSHEPIWQLEHSIFFGIKRAAFTALVEWTLTAEEESIDKKSDMVVNLASLFFKEVETGRWALEVYRCWGKNIIFGLFSQSVATTASQTKWKNKVWVWRKPLPAPCDTSRPVCDLLPVIARRTFCCCLFTSDTSSSQPLSLSLKVQYQWESHKTVTTLWEHFDYFWK